MDILITLLLIPVAICSAIIAGFLGIGSLMFVFGDEYCRMLAMSLFHVFGIGTGCVLATSCLIIVAVHPGTGWTNQPTLNASTISDVSECLILDELPVLENNFK